MALRIRHLIPTLISFFCLMQSDATAQTTPQDIPKFRVLSMSAFETVLFDIDKEPIVLRSSLGSFSRLYPSPKDGNVVFYKETPNPQDPNLPPIKTTLAQAKLSEGGPYIILLIRNPAGSSLEYKTVVLDHSLEKFPANTYRVYNYSKRQLAVQLSETNLLLNTGESGSVPYPASSKTWLKVAANDQDEGWLVVRSAPQTTGTNNRTTLFLVDIPPSERDPNPLGIIDREMRERIRTDEQGRQYVR
ncbi:hypothetical protein SH580_17425 [Coraliomargarita algicola]|uniref:DUF4397 domain-containing protein n=1 Tax=Coraliomargarita algicola TaxID=3092156 RepID=A0ABZ0RIJ8_9BACT|nr:hypothetical protein [Coraliomargarita sp. J2-16]WPJ95206.1 hypothetical protein SH580_17425 [Coraliomargarita sp. J2-16]